ncbi:hypothetical protein ACLOJK_018927, partial [Asimina triloba]
MDGHLQIPGYKMKAAIITIQRACGPPNQQFIDRKQRGPRQMKVGDRDRAAPSISHQDPAVQNPSNRRPIRRQHLRSMASSSG